MKNPLNTTSSFCILRRIHIVLILCLLGWVQLITPTSLLSTLLSTFNFTTSLKAQSPVNERTIYVFGDSWAAQMSGRLGVFEQELQDRAYDSFITISPWAQGGSTAAGWAEVGELEALKTAIANDPNPNPIVFFTLGGNDLLNAGATTPTDEAYSDIQQNINTIVSELLTAREDMQIVSGGYDSFNLASSASCTAVFAEALGTTDPTVLNQAIHNVYTQHATIAANYTNYTAVNTSGSLQGNPGNPDFSQWSPAEYMNDCLHLNADGYSIYLDTVFDNALDQLICADAPGACPSTTIELPDTSQPATDPTETPANTGSTIYLPLISVNSEE
ncbi:MAG: SGNH/GDSL hydrolase family protein [Chloroflexota bacterium]